MGLRFRRRIGIIPGLLRLNVSLRGISASVGRPGATINVSPTRGTRATVGLPGSGISYSEQIAPASGSGRAVLLLIVLAVMAGAYLLA